MTKRIYMDKLNGNMNQRLVNFINNKQLSTWDKNNFYKHKKRYPILKVWILFEFNSFMPQQFIPSIEAKINFIDNGRQQSFTLAPVSINITPSPTNAFIYPLPDFMPVPLNVTPDFANAFNSTLVIYQPTITFKSAQTSSLPAANLLQQPFNAFANLYT